MTEASAPPPQQSRNAPSQSAGRPASQSAPQAAQQAGVQAPPQGVPGRPTWEAGPANAQNWEPARDVAIVPVESGGSDPSFGFDWQAVEVDTSRTCSCVVRAAEDHVLSVRIEQPPYDRTLRGTGSVAVQLIPVGAVGVKGRLVARDEVTGATAEFTWEWKPIGKAKWANPSRPMAQMASQTARAAAPAQGGQRAAASAATATADAEGQAKAALGPAVAATFFGVPSLAQRFGFVLDMSGSMSGQRWSACVKQLAKALEGLTEGSEIFVVLFSDHLATPTKEAVWVSASQEWKQTVLDWVSRVSPSGGTFPQPAFDLIFSLPVRPDVIYFLTDGEFASPSPSRLQKQCHGIGTGVLSTLGNLIIKKDESKGPPPTIINTITLDDPSGASMCKDIARKAGGQYVHVSSGDNA
jgi:hypothetical protein